MDVGGTFTDAVLLTGKRLVTGKAPTTPADQSDGMLDAVEQALAAAGAESEVERFVHSMTVGTNALLEGRVARTALLATEGFTDLEELGPRRAPSCTGSAPAIRPDRARRAAAGGSRAQRARRRAAPLDEQALAASLGSLPEVEAVAVCLLWGFRHPGHEQRVAELVARARPELHVSTSHETAGVFREYERCATTIVDAALPPPAAATSSGWPSAPPRPASRSPR